MRRLALVSTIAACGTQGVDPATQTEPPPPAAPWPASDAGSPSSPVSTGTDPVAGPPRVRFIGRFDTRDAAGPWCAWPGCRIVAKFAGTEVSVRLNEVTLSWMLGGPSEWDVTIDGTLRPKLVLQTGEHVYALASGLPQGEHVVELFKRSEAQNGFTQFLGYDFGDGELLSPPPPATRRIEIVGDSQPAAFGVDAMGLGPNCPGVDWAAKYENFHESFGAILGTTFGADVTGSVYSGKGVVRNIDRSDPETLPRLWPRANPVFADSLFDLASLVPDVVIVMIGGNDFAIGEPDVLLDPAVFTQGYRDFEATLRKNYPSAHIWLVVSPSVTDDNPPGRASRTNIANAVHAIVTGAGDPRLHEASPPLATPDELVGCNGHGTPAYHRRVAAQLAAILRPELGW